MGLSVDLEKVFYDNMKKTVLKKNRLIFQKDFFSKLECCEKKQLHYQHRRQSNKGGDEENYKK